ncbi:MAG: hypothetical protein WC637_00310 [Victivallales bacterium]|jgi:hypothetical protein
MASVEGNIKPTGLSQRLLVTLLYMIVYSIQGICQKLDDDATVPLTTYEANVYTAIFNGYIEDVRGNTIMNRVSTADDRFFILTPNGVTPKAILECLYQIFDMMETLTEQLDTDGITTSTYEALCYTALYVWIVENVKGNQLGNGTAYYFRPGGETDQKQLVDLLYAIVDSIETLTEKLDTDAGTTPPTDTDYEALWFTATILMRVQSSAGNVVGNDITITP